MLLTHLLLLVLYDVSLPCYFLSLLVIGSPFLLFLTSPPFFVVYKSRCIQFLRHYCFFNMGDTVENNLSILHGVAVPSPGSGGEPAESVATPPAGSPVVVTEDDRFVCLLCLVILFVCLFLIVCLIIFNCSFYPVLDLLSSPEAMSLPPSPIPSTSGLVRPPPTPVDDFQPPTAVKADMAIVPPSYPSSRMTFEEQDEILARCHEYLITGSGDLSVRRFAFANGAVQIFGASPAVRPLFLEKFPPSHILIDISRTESRYSCTFYLPFPSASVRRVSDVLRPIYFPPSYVFSFTRFSQEGRTALAELSLGEMDVRRIRRIGTRVRCILGGFIRCSIRRIPLV